MSFFSLFGILVISAIISLMLREASFGIYRTAAVALGIFTCLIVLTAYKDSILSFFSLMDALDERYSVPLIKAVGIGAVAEIGAEMCSDMGENTISARVRLLGKLEILYLCLSPVKELITASMELI